MPRWDPDVKGFTPFSAIGVMAIGQNCSDAGRSKAYSSTTRPYTIIAKEVPMNKLLGLLGYAALLGLVIISMKDIAAAADGVRAQSEQTARSMVDQAKAMREMTSAAQGTAKHIKLITKANVEHSTTATALLGSIAEVRTITDRNASGVKQTRGGTDDLLRRAQALLAIVNRPSTARSGNGRASRSHR